MLDAVYEQADSFPDKFRVNRDEVPRFTPSRISSRTRRAAAAELIA